jgi:hypothetical protein
MDKYIQNYRYGNTLHKRKYKIELILSSYYPSGYNFEAFLPAGAFMALHLFTKTWSCILPCGT